MAHTLCLANFLLLYHSLCIPVLWKLVPHYYLSRCFESKFILTNEIVITVENTADTGEMSPLV
jgi:hypothetical protein